MSNKAGKGEPGPSDGKPQTGRRYIVGDSANFPTFQVATAPPAPVKPATSQAPGGKATVKKQ